MILIETCELTERKLKTKGKTFAQCLPVLELIAAQNNLNLKDVRQFNKAVKILKYKSINNN